MADTSFPLFKGCTRPATFMGVPFAPFFLVNGVLLWLGIVTPWKPILLLVIPATFVMRMIAKEDEYRFRQWGLAILLLTPLLGVRRVWSDCWSFSPANAKTGRNHVQWLVSPPEWLLAQQREKNRDAGIFTARAEDDAVTDEDNDETYSVRADGMSRTAQ